MAPQPDVSTRCDAGTDGGVIDGGESVQLFHVANATLHLENMQLVGGLGVDGGAVYATEGAKVVVSTCSFSVNDAWNGSGGAQCNGKRDSPALPRYFSNAEDVPRRVRGRA